MSSLGPKDRIHKSPEFLRFAKSLGGECCICRWTQGVSVRADELHHYGEKGMGQRANDHFVARLCVPCHQHYQGKRRLSLIRDGQIDILEALESDNLEILTQWARRIEGKKKPSERCYRCGTCDYHTGDACLASLPHDEPPRDCAREEALEKALDVCPDDVDGFMAWAIQWANTRYASVLGGLGEVLSEIANGNLSAEDARFTAEVALKRGKMEAMFKKEREGV